MGYESFDVVSFDLWPLFQGQIRIAKIKSAYYSLILAPSFMCNCVLSRHSTRKCPLIMSTPLGDGHIIFAFSGFQTF